MKEDAMPKRPWMVTTAFYMLWLSILGLPAISIWWKYSGVINWRGLEGVISWRKLVDVINWRGSEGVISGSLVAYVGFALGYWLTLALVVYMVGRGRNWARIILLILLLLFTPSLLLSIIRDSGHSAFPGPLYQLFQIEIWIVAVVLLFQRSSSDWFKTVKKLRSKDESPAAI